MPLENTEHFNTPETIENPSITNETIIDTPLQEIEVSDYLKRLHENPRWVEPTREEKSQEWSRSQNHIQAQIRNDRTLRQVQESLDAGIFQEMGYFPLANDIESADAYYDAIKAGYKVHSFIKYNDQNEIIGHSYYKEKYSDDPMVINLKVMLEEKYEEEILHSWEAEEHEKEQRLIEKVQRGEMAYLGEKTLDQYLTMRKNGLPLRAIVKVVVFNKDHERGNTERIYAKL